MFQTHTVQPVTGSLSPSVTLGRGTKVPDLLDPRPRVKQLQVTRQGSPTAQELGGDCPLGVGSAVGGKPSWKLAVKPRMTDAQYWQDDAHGRCSWGRGGGVEG